MVWLSDPMAGCCPEGDSFVRLGRFDVWEEGTVLN